MESFLCSFVFKHVLRHLCMTSIAFTCHKAEHYLAENPGSSKRGCQN